MSRILSTLEAEAENSTLKVGFVYLDELEASVVDSETVSELF